MNKIIWTSEDVQEYSKIEWTELSLLHPYFHELLGEIKEKKIVDYGCGEGRLLQELIQRKAKVYGYDISASMIEEAKKRLEGITELKTIASGEIPLSNNSIDAVVSNLVLMMIPNAEEIRKVFQEVNRILIPDGTFTFCVTHPCFLDQKHNFYYNIFPQGFDYLKEPQAYNFVLIDSKGREISNPSFIDYSYSFGTYLNLLCENNFTLIKTIEVKTDRDKFPPYLILHARK